MTASAVIWDFDRTLADTRVRNLNVTRTFIALVTGRPASAYEPSTR
jgi:hypothetical protein